jgi:hypothetical protein
MATDQPTSIADASEWPYRFEVVKVDQMVIDHVYQRPATSFVAKIAENFNPALIGTLVLSERKPGSTYLDEDGEKHKTEGVQFAVVDGQTRREGAKLRDVLELPALVYSGMTVAQEAGLFASLQKERRGIASFHRFRADLVNGDPQAVDIEKIVKGTGYTIGVDRKAGDISAVAALEAAYKRGADTLERTMVILKAAWPDTVPDGGVIRGMSYLIVRLPSMDDERMVSRLRDVTMTDLARRASALREGTGLGGGSDKYMADALEGVYKRRVS